MLRGRGGEDELRLVAPAAGAGAGVSRRFHASAGRAAGVYGDGAADLVSAMCGRPSARWRRHGPAAAEVVAVAPLRASVWSVLSRVASHFSHRAPSRAAAAAAEAAELGDLRGAVVAELSICDRRCVGLAAAALTGARFLVLPRADEALTPREVVVLATAIMRCTCELGVGVVFDAAATRNAFWADDVWHVGVRCGAERVCTSACAADSSPGTVAGWVGGAGSG